MNHNPVVMSAFDGMSCGQIAFNKMGVIPSIYYASEIDQYAMSVTQANYPNTIQMGDITKWREWDIDWSTIDYLIGGSPCQGFSSAGKKGGTKATLNGDTIIVSDRVTYEYMKVAGAEFLSHSHLFWEYVLLLDHIRSCNPDVRFMLENVKMSKLNLDLITEALGVEPVFINSSLVSAQNRQRFYWCNWEVEQPEDFGFLLKDILETGVVDRDKAYALTARYFKAGNFNRYADKSSDQLIFELFGLSDKCIAKFKRYGVSFLTHDTSIAKLLTAGDYGKLGKYGNYLESLDCETQIRKLTPIECERLQNVPDHYTALAIDLPVAFTERRTEEAKRIRREHREKHGTDFSPRRGKELVARNDGKMNCLTAAYSMKEHTIIDEQGIYRKLTPTEWERLQNVPDDHTKRVSNTQRYRMLGNGWNVNTVMHILSRSFFS